jgi:Mce-associated membrane protein
MTRRISRVISDARTRPRTGDEVAGPAVPDADGPGEPPQYEPPAASGRSGRTPFALLSRALGVLLVLLLAGLGYLWVTRPTPSSIRVADYAGALEGARSAVIDLTSFDYLTLDDNLRQIQAVTTGDLRKESTDKLNQNRKTIVDSQAVFSTKVLENGAGVTKVSSKAATVVMVIETTQKTKASTQAQVTRFRIEVQMSKVNGRWLMSGISGR